MEGIALTATKPRYLTGLLLLAWGWQAEFLLTAIPMALLIEGRYFFNRRWALTQQDFYRVADLTAVAFIGLLVYLFNNALTTNLIVSLLQWLPMLFYPLVIVLAFSTNERMTLDVLFYSLRRQREPVTQSWDMDYFLVFICLAAIGSDPEAALLFAAAISLTLAWMFLPLKPGRYNIIVWVLVLLTALALGAGTSVTLREAHLSLKEQTGRWLARWIQRRTDPLRTRTAIGRLGELKLSEEIRFRVEPLNEQRTPALLVEAVYDMPSADDWMALNPDFQILPHADDFRWEINQPSPEDAGLNIYLTFDRRHELVPVPSSVTQVTDLPAVDIRRSRYGTLQGADMLPSPVYRVDFNPARSIYSKPDSAELYMPEELATLFKDIDPESFANDLDKVNFVRSYFRDFRYSLYQRGNNHGLHEFLNETRAGHCEYFASATTLMLRHLGLPARYAVGYSLQEWDADLGMYLVRERHRHAWSLVFAEGAWQVVDTTPAIWADEEATQASPLQPLLDQVSNLTFRFSVWWNKQRLEDYELELYIIGGLLTLILIWRIVRSEQVIVEEADIAGTSGRAQSGQASPFQRIVNHLEQQGYERGPGETTPPWLRRIERDELLPLMPLHYRWRFDYHALSEQDRTRLIEAVDEWMHQQQPS